MAGDYLKQLGVREAATFPIRTPAFEKVMFCKVYPVPRHA